QNYAEKMTEAQKHRRFKIVRDQLQHLTILLDAVLMIGKFEAEAVAFQPVAIDLDAFCHDIVDEFQDVNPDRQLHYSCANPDLCQITGDRILLRQAVSNVITNALKYSQEPVEVRLAGRAEEV